MSQLDVKGLPVNLEAERYVLGSILIDDGKFAKVASVLQPGDFSLMKHQIIFGAMRQLHTAGSAIDRATLSEQLIREGKLEACDGVSYVVSIDDGLPYIENIDSYVRIVKEKSVARQTITSLYAAQEAILRDGEANGTLGALRSRITELDVQASSDLTTGKETAIASILETWPGGLDGLVHPKHTGAIQTGFLRLDEALGGGLRHQEFVVLAARPGMGKTAIALNMAVTMARQGKPVLFHCMEMSRQQLLMRLAAATARINLLAYRANHLNYDEQTRLRNSFNLLSKLPLYLDDTIRLTPGHIYASAARIKPALVVIDHLGLMAINDDRRSRNDAIGAVTRELKNIALELNVAILCLCQLNRQSDRENRAPELRDLRDSGRIEEDAVIVLMLDREELRRRDREDLRGNADLYIRKQRDGPLARIKLVFLQEFTKFENRTDDLPDE